MTIRPSGTWSSTISRTRASRRSPPRAQQDMVRHFADGKPHLVVLDLHLGQEDGLDLLRDIRSDFDTPVIISTGHRRRRSTASSGWSSAPTTT